MIKSGNNNLKSKQQLTIKLAETIKKIFLIATNTVHT